MTPEQHNKFLGIAYLAYACFHLLLMAATMVLLGAIARQYYTMTSFMSSEDAFPFPFMFIFMGFFYGVTTIPAVVAGYSLLKRRRWAKIAAIIGAVVAAMNFPIGTAVCVYSFWFVFSEPGKLLYDEPVQALPPQPKPGWTTYHVPPGRPPDWH